MRSEFESGVFSEEKNGSFESTISQIGKWRRGLLPFPGNGSYRTLSDSQKPGLCEWQFKKKLYLGWSLKTGTIKVAFMDFPVYYYTITTQVWPDKQ